MQRRFFLQAAGSSLVIPPLLAGCQGATTPTPAATTNTSGQRLEKFGLQLSTVTSLMLADFEGTLAKVAEIGYQQVEFSAMGFLGRPVNQIQNLLQTLNLEAPVARITPKLPAGFFSLPRDKARAVYFERSQPDFFLDNVAHSLDSAIALGQKTLVLPALGPDNFKSLDQVKANVELINKAGELCARENVMFGYHNHNWELAPVDNTLPYDFMLEQTDPDHVTFQLDAYWITKGGGDLSDYLNRYPGRFSTCHLKDIDDSGDFADVGSGRIDFPRFVREAQAQGARYFFVERDNPPEPEQSVRNSFAYVKQMTF